MRVVSPRPERTSWLTPLVALAVATVFVVPLATLLVRGSLSTTVELATSATVLEPLRRSVTLGLASAAACAVLGTAMAWVVMRTDVPGRRLLRVVAAVPLVIPSFLGAATLSSAFAPGGVLSEVTGWQDLPRPEGLIGAVVVISMLSYPYVYLPVAARLAALPASLEESARLLGRGRRQVFAEIVLPQVSPAVVAGSVLVFLYAMADFAVVQLLRYDTLTRVIYESRNDPPVYRAAGATLAVAALVVVAVEMRLSRRLATTASVRSRIVRPAPLGRWRWVAGASAWTVVGLAVLVPMAVMVWWIARSEQRVGSIDGDLVGPLMSSVTFGVLAAVCSVAVVLPVAYLTRRGRGVVSSVASAAMVAGFALPGVVIAIALVDLVLHVPVADRLYQTLPVLILAYVVHFGGQALRTGQVAVDTVPQRLDDAARLLGAGRWRRMRTVELPLMAPVLAAGGGMVLLNTLKELPATKLLSPPGTSTLATRAWNAWEAASFSQTGHAGLVLLGASGVLGWLLVLRRIDR